MLRRLTMFTMLALIATSNIQASDESMAFQFWVDYGIGDFPIDGLVLLDDQAQQVDQIILWDLFENTSIVAYAISPGGRLFAIAGSTHFPEDIGDHLYVYDTVTDTMLMEVPATTSEFMTLAFAGETQVASSAQIEEGRWSINVYDIATGQVSHSLTNEQLSSSFPSYETYPWLPPVIRAFDGTRLYFAAVNQIREKQSFVWSLVDEVVNSDIVYLNDGARLLAATGEVVLPFLDDRLLFYVEPDQPLRTPHFYTGYAGNTVHVYDLAQGIYFPVHNEANGFIFDVYWVQNGERLLVGVSEGFSSLLRWVLLERDGRVVGTIMTGSLDNFPRNGGLLNTPDGFLVRTGFMQITDPTNPEEPAEELTPSTIYAYNTRNMTYQGYADQLLYEFDYKPPQSPAIIWSSLAEPSAPFSSFEPLMPPIPSSEVSTEALSLRVNGAAYVNTINGETLNVRDAPSLSGEVLAQAQNNQRFLLLEGPVAADGFTWWKVLWSEREIVGWAVQGVEDEITLRPPEINRAAPLTLVEANLILGNTGFAPLEVGMSVRVISDNLFIRATTSLNATVDHVLLRGARLTLVNGYIEAEGLRWWEVVTDDGLTGWAADSNPDGELTLAPAE